MADFEKLIEGLQRCTDDSGERCEGCSYAVLVRIDYENCKATLTYDVIPAIERR